MNGERRHFDRTEITGWVGKLTAAGRTIAGPIVNIGAGGVAIDCPSFEASSGPCWLKMSRGANLVIEVVGRIAWVDRRYVGVDFVDISPDDFQSIQSLVRQELAPAAVESAV
jgi:hypothetical protein